MKSSHVSPRTLARIRADLKRLGIRYLDVAAEAAKTSTKGSVSDTMVNHFLAGRRKSANVHATAKRLIAEAKARANGAVA